MKKKKRCLADQRNPFSWAVFNGRPGDWRTWRQLQGKLSWGGRAAACSAERDGRPDLALGHCRALSQGGEAPSHVSSSVVLPQTRDGERGPEDLHSRSVQDTSSTSDAQGVTKL